MTLNDSLLIDVSTCSCCLCASTLFRERRCHMRDDHFYWGFLSLASLWLLTMKSIRVLGCPSLLICRSILVCQICGRLAIRETFQIVRMIYTPMILYFTDNWHITIRVSMHATLQQIIRSDQEFLSVSSLVYCLDVSDKGFTHIMRDVADEWAFDIELFSSISQISFPFS